MLDFNQSLDPAEASRRIERLTPYDLHWIEEPVAQENLLGHAKVRDMSPTPIQAGENWWFPRGFAEAIAVGASDFIMPDLMKCGGVTGGSGSPARPKPPRFRCRAIYSPRPVPTCWR